jgi:hypothetical protein
MSRPNDAAQLAATATLITAAAWPYSQPPVALLAANAADPAVAAMRVDITDLLRHTLAVTISGLLARNEDLPVGAGSISAIQSPDRLAASAPTGRL